MKKQGFTLSSSFQVAEAVNDSFVTVELLLLRGTKTIVALRIVHNKTSIEAGSRMVTGGGSTDKNHFNQLVPLLQALMDYSANNLVAIRRTLLQNEKWSPAYTCIVSSATSVFPSRVCD